MSQEFDSPAATQQAEPATDPPSAATRLVTWHDDLVVWVDQLGWLRAYVIQLGPVLTIDPQAGNVTWQRS